MAFTLGNQSQNIFSKLKSMSPTRRFDMLRNQQRKGDASPFTLLTPVEFAELFPKYYLRTMPDVKGFYDALSKKKAGGGQLAEGEATTSSGASVSSSEKVTNVVKAKEIYDYIRSKGVDHLHAVGIINNMKYESHFDSGIIGDKGTSGGLFQHHASRFAAMKQYVGADWQTNWKKQIDFAMTERDMKIYLSRNLANASDASQRFTEDFERPANTTTQAMYRSHTANGYADAMLGKAGEPSGGQTAGGSYEFTSKGFVVPKDKTLYDQGNEEQCATMAKGMNPGLGRTSGWTVVEGPIKPGVVVATTRYNLPGGDRTGAGYHTGVAMTAPDEQGNFLLLEQFNGQSPRVRQVNKDRYSGGALGGDVKFGIVQSNGRLHDEQSLEALRYGSTLVDEEQRKRIMNNIDAIEKGGTQGGSGTGTGSVEYKNDETSSVQPQNNFQQQQASTVASTTQISDVMKMFGGGQFGQVMDMISMLSGKGEGMGSGRRHHKNKHTARVEPDVPMFLPETRRDIGSITRQWETGKYGDSAQFGVGTISSGKRDPGGVSYGENQLSSKKGTMKEFLNSPEGRQFAGAFGKTRPGSAAFNKTYTNIANTQGADFAKAQHDYLDRTHYKPVLKIAAKLGYNVDDPRVQESLWGGGIQFRHNMNRILKSKETLEAIGKSAEEQVKALQEAKQRFAPKIKNRYQYEEQAILGQKPGGGYGNATVMDMSKYAGYEFDQKSKRAAFVAEQNKAKMMAAQKAPTPGVATSVTNPLMGPTPATAGQQDNQFKGAVDFAPPSVLDENYLQQQQMTPARPDKSSLAPIETPQKQVSINPLEQRPSHMQPTPSLARAMNNARGVVDSSYKSLSDTQLG